MTWEGLFWAKVDKTDGCWYWTGTQLRGYGKYKRNGIVGTTLAHRIAYELTVGPIPEGLTIDHLCRNTLCVRPDHLEPVTMLENIRRARKDFCKHGHPLAGENLYFATKKTGHVVRGCRTCVREWNHSHYVSVTKVGK